MAYPPFHPNVSDSDQTGVGVSLQSDHSYGTEMPASDMYQTGNYWLTGSQIMNCVFPSDHLADIAFDPLEELVWCITRMGQLTAFYSVSMERYITTTIALLPTPTDNELEPQYGELKQVFPSPRPSEHAVYILASNALHAYTKFGRPFAYATDKLMVDLECLAATGPTGANPGFSMGGGNAWGASNEADFSRIFLGGLQPTLLELDAQERWGEVIKTTDVGVGGCVVLRSFSSGLCAGTTNGQVIVLDPRTPRGIVRELDAHTGEISDITVAPFGYSLVTCGWSRLGGTGLRVDRLLKVYDLRSGRAQAPLSASLDPCFTRFFPSRTARILTASQGGSFQLIEWGNHSFSPDDMGQLWPTYDRLVALDISHNGNGIVFGTETGHLQLYLRDINVYQFNSASLPTEFASPLAEGLWPTNSVGANLPPSYPLMLMEDPANSLYGTNMMALAKAAADAAELQLLAASLHQPAATASDNMNKSESFELVERRKAEAANEAVMVAYKPVEYDDYRFSSASVPFCANPPPVLTVETGNSSDSSTHTRSHRTENMSTSDWPEDLCQSKPRPMIPVDPELIVGANRKRAVRKPPHWGSVWYPYVDEPVTSTSEDTTLGRFVSVSPIGVASAS